MVFANGFQGDLTRGGLYVLSAWLFMNYDALE